MASATVEPKARDARDSALQRRVNDLVPAVIEALAQAQREQKWQDALGRYEAAGIAMEHTEEAADNAVDTPESRMRDLIFDAVVAGTAIASGSL